MKPQRRSPRRFRVWLQKTALQFVPSCITYYRTVQRTPPSKAQGSDNAIGCSPRRGRCRIRCAESLGLWNLALGVTLLLILLAFDKDRDKSWLHLLAFGAVAGLCCVVTTGVFAELLLEAIGRPVPPPAYAWIEVAGQKYYSLSTEAASRLKDYEAATLWFAFGILGSFYAGVKRGRWFSQRAC